MFSNTRVKFRETMLKYKFFQFGQLIRRKSIGIIDDPLSAQKFKQFANTLWSLFGPFCQNFICVFSRHHPLIIWVPIQRQPLVVEFLLRQSITQKR